MSRQQFRAVDHFIAFQNTLHARPLQRRTKHIVRCNHRPGMRCRGRSRLGKATGFVGDDRLAAGIGPRRGHELPRIGDRFDIEHNRSRPGALAEIVDQIGKAHIEHVADRNKV